MRRMDTYISDYNIIGYRYVNHKRVIVEFIIRKNTPYIVNIIYGKNGFYRIYADNGVIVDFLNYQVFHRYFTHISGNRRLRTLARYRKKHYKTWYKDFSLFFKPHIQITRCRKINDKHFEVDNTSTLKLLFVDNTAYGI